MAHPKGRSGNDSSKNKLTGAGGPTHDELKKAYNLSPVCTLGVNADLLVNYANSAASGCFGLAESGLVGRPLFDILQDTSADKLNEAKVRQSEIITDQEFVIDNPFNRRWVLVSSSVHTDNDGIVQTYLFARDITALKKKEKLITYLNDAAAALAKARHTAGALELISKFIVPKFADWFTVDQVKGDKMELALLKHQDEEKIKWAYKYREAYPPDPNGNSGSAVVIKTGKPGFVPVITGEMINQVVANPLQREEIKKIGMHSAIIAPMVINEKVSGVVTFISSEPGRHFDEMDLDFALNFAMLIGLALENTRLNEESEKEIAARKQSEEQFRFLTDAIPHKLWTSGRDGRATYYNRQWYDYTGIEGFEALRDQIWNFIHPDERAKAALEWPAAIERGEPVETEQRLRSRAGEYRWHLSRFSAFMNEEGAISLWVGTSTDVHEQKTVGMELAAANEELTAANEEMVAVNEEAAAANEELASMNEEVAATNEELAATNEELASTNEELALANEELARAQANLQQSEKLFRSIALNIPGSLIIVIDKNHRYVTIEGDIMEKMGYERSDYEGKHPLEVGPAERYEASRELYERVIAGEQFSIERKAETGENFMVHFVPLRNEAGEVEAGLIIALDITEIKKGEERSAKLAAIITSSDDAIVSKTLESVVTSWNKAAERMFGYTEEEMLGETIYKIIPPDRYDEEPRILARLRSGERVEHYETKRQRKDGKLVDVSLTVSALKDVKGNIIGLAKIARDITEKKLEEQRKNDFIGMVSHELKTPLTTLSAIIQVADSRLKDSTDTFIATAMARANQQVKRMTAMVNGFLNISRLEAGRMLIEKQPFGLDKLLRELLDETKLIVQTHTITLSGSGRVQVDADADKINSVLSNLVSNAIKYSPRGTNIELAYRVEGGKVTVSVRDEGIGLKPDDTDRVFDRYFRVENSDTRHISGFGIGLYLSAEIIRRHEGTIGVDSEYGKGSTFYFTLPVIS